MKKLIVRLFFRFKVERGKTGKYLICFKPPFRGWYTLGGEFFTLRKLAEKRAEEYRKDGAFLFDAIRSADETH